MNSYYDLRDDIEFPNRWHLGDIDFEDVYSDDFLCAKSISIHKSIPVPVYRTGASMEFSLTSFAVPVAREALVRAISAVAGQDLQQIPITIAGHEGYVALNSLRMVECLDERRSDFLKWTKDDHRPELAGQYRMVPKLLIDPGRVPSDAHFFRIKGWSIALIVSQAVKDAMTSYGCAGAEFQSVT